jgi:hypothetical protein
MQPHVFKPDPHGRDVCDFKAEVDGRRAFCGEKRAAEVHTPAYTFTPAQREKAVEFLQEFGCYDEEDDAELANWLAQLLADERKELQQTLNDALASLPSGTSVHEQNAAIAKAALRWATGK